MAENAGLKNLGRALGVVTGISGSLALLWVAATPSAAIDTINSPDTVGVVGYYTSIALDAQGNPVISYQDRTFEYLKVLHCNDPACSPGGDIINTPDTGPAGVGQSTSLGLDALGNPVVSYYDRSNADLKILHCDDPNCAPGGNSITSPDTAGSVGASTSLVLDADGYPVVAYSDGTNSDLNLLHCNDPNCQPGGDSITSPDTAGDPGEYPSLMLDSKGNPVVSYYEHSLGDLRILHCDDPNCAPGGDSVTTPDSEFFVGTWTSLALDDLGNPVVSYRQDTFYFLKILHCDDPNCTPGGDSITSPDTTGSNGEFTSIALDALGNPVVSYQGNTSGADLYDLKILHCDDSNCSPGGDNISEPDPSTGEGWWASMTLDAVGNPVVSYQNSDSDLKVLHCDDPNCDLSTPPTPTSVPTATPSAMPTPTPTATATATPTPTPSATPTSTATPTSAPTAGNHDARLKKVSAAQTVTLPTTKVVSVRVRNQGDHAEQIAVYADMVPPGGMTNPNGCTPVGRVINTVVTLGPGAETTVSVNLAFDCSNRAGALNESYTIMAAADAHADDGGACPVFQIQSMTCYMALADDDNDPGDNRATTNSFRVK